MMKAKKYLLLLSMSLILINLLAHFLPFERSSVANDDYALLAIANNFSLPDVFFLTARQADRPLSFLILMLKEKLLDGNPERGLLLIVFTTSLVLLSVFFLLETLLDDPLLAMIGAITFSLIPNKLEVYHLPILAYTDIANFLSIFSFIAFIYYAREQKRSALLLSVFSYTMTIFLYEAGFFIPFIFAVYFYLYKRGRLNTVLYFAIPSSIYLVFKFTGAFVGADPFVLPYREPSLLMLPTNLLDLLHQYFGRYIVRNILYGGYQFLSVESPWFGVMIFSNVALLIFMAFWLRKKELSGTDDRICVLAGTIFIFSLIPVLLNGFGGVGGRHLVLPSIGVSLFAIWLLGKTKRAWRPVLFAWTAFALIVSQGNAWAQVVACRINAAAYETLREKAAELRRADRVIIDTKSFADSIPFTWVQRDFNVLNTYYGAQAFEDWGLRSMVTLATGGTGKPVYIATESPRVIGQGLLEFAVSEYRGYRSVSKKVEAVPQEGTVIIDFKSVFGEQFNNGIRTVSR